MRRNLPLTLAFALACAAQTVVPPQDCAKARQQTASADPGCPVSPGPISGIGTAGTVPIFTSTNTLGNSTVNQNSSGAIGIGGQAPSGAKLGVVGNIAATGDITANKVTATGTLSAPGVTIGSDNILANGDISAAQFSIGSEPVVRASFPGNADNTIVGIRAGKSIGSSVNNTVVGAGAGQSASGNNNSFFGRIAGTSNTGANNSFFGSAAGAANFSGSDNSFFGAAAGHFNEGSQNALFGSGAGKNNHGDEGAFFGDDAGTGNVGDRNTLLGAHAVGGGPGNVITNATAVGNRAVVAKSNSLVLGSIKDVNGATATVNVGIGITAPRARLEVASGDIFVSQAGRGIILKSVANTCARLTLNSATSKIDVEPVPCP